MNAQDIKRQCPTKEAQLERVNQLLEQRIISGTTHAALLETLELLGMPIPGVTQHDRIALKGLPLKDYRSIQAKDPEGKWVEYCGEPEPPKPTIAKLDIKPGEVLILSFPAKWSQERQAMLAKTLRDACPNNTVALLPDDVKLHVVSQQQPDLRSRVDDAIRFFKG